MSFRVIVLLVLAAAGLFVSGDALRAQDTTAVADTVDIDIDAETRLVPQTEQDSLLALRIQRVFDSIEGFRAVEVSVQHAVVRLTGTVQQPDQRDEARELAASFDEVRYVLVDLETNLDVDARVTPAVRRIRAYLDNAVDYLPVLAVALVVLLLFGFLARLVNGLRGLLTRFGTTPLVANLVLRVLRFVVWIIGLILALDILGVTALVGAVLGAAGLVGIAIGFAFQDIIENYLAGVLLSVRHPFTLNDLVRVGAEEGRVVRLTSRELVLMTLDGNHVRIPNAVVFKSTLYNFTRNPLRRFSIEVGVDVDEDLMQVQAVGVNTLQAMPGVLADPEPVMRIKSLGDSNVVVVFYGWVDQTQAAFDKVRSEAIRLVKTALDEADVLMPEPIYNVRMQQVPPPSAKTTLDRKAEQKPPAQPVEVQAAQADVSVETDIEEQIREDLATSDEPNLLKK